MKQVMSSSQKIYSKLQLYSFLLYFKHLSILLHLLSFPNALLECGLVYGSLLGETGSVFTKLNA